MKVNQFWLKNQTDHWLLTAKPVTNANQLIHHFTVVEANYALGLSYAMVINQILLGSLPLVKLTLHQNQLVLVFQPVKPLKLKQLRLQWAKQSLTAVTNPVVGQIAKLESSIFQSLPLNITVKVDPSLVATLATATKLELANLSTFIDNDITLAKLVVNITHSAKFVVNDHRALNQQLKFFYFAKQLGSGLPFWLPRGVIVKRLIQDYLHKLETAAGFVFVESPILGSQWMYETSQHLSHYQTFMFPALKRNNEVLYLRPMTCPHHCLIYQSELRSYHDLPFRISENAYLFRQEASGALIGLERVRQMQLKDSHIFVSADRSMLAQAIRQCFKMTQTALKALGIKINCIYLSVNDPAAKTKFIQAPKLWTDTTTILQAVLQELAIDYQLMQGEAAFYGPKIDFQINTALGHNLTVSTIQLDFALPAKFKLKYRSPTTDQTYHQPILIHHGLIGTYERLLTILMEQNAGWLPFWLSPVQIIIIPLHSNAKVQGYAQKIHQLLQQYQLRAKLADSTKKLAENIKLSWIERVPFRVFIGETECAKQQVTFQNRQNIKQTSELFVFIDHCLKLVKQLHEPTV